MAGAAADRVRRRKGVAQCANTRPASRAFRGRKQARPAAVSPPRMVVLDRDGRSIRNGRCTRNDLTLGLDADRVRHRQVAPVDATVSGWGDGDLEQIATLVSSKTPSTGLAPRLLDDILAVQLRERHYSELEAVLVVVARSGLVLGLDAAVEPSEALRQLRRGPGVDAFTSFLLRLLAADRQLIDDSPLRAQVALFLDREYGDVLRPYYERPPRGGTHDVLSSCQAVAPALESEASDLIIGLKGLSGLTAFRQGLMRLIGGAPGRVAIRPFLPEEALGSNLTDFFATAEAMRDSDDDLNVIHGRLEEQAHVLEYEVGERRAADMPPSDPHGAGHHRCVSSRPLPHRACGSPAHGVPPGSR